MVEVAARTRPEELLTRLEALEQPELATTAEAVEPARGREVAARVLLLRTARSTREAVAEEEVAAREVAAREAEDEVEAETSPEATTLLPPSSATSSMMLLGVPSLPRVVPATGSARSSSTDAAR